MRKQKKSIILGEFSRTGSVRIDTDLVSERWNHLYFLSEWRDDDTEWRLIKFVRKDSPITETKLTISSNQAKELIEKLGLVETSEAFRSGFSWRREVDTEYLEKWRREKYSK